MTNPLKLSGSMMPTHWVVFGVLVVGAISLALTPAFKAHFSDIALILASTLAAFLLLAVLILIGFREGGVRAWYVAWLAIETAIVFIARLVISSNG